MNRPPTYPATRAANVMLVVSILMAAVLLFAGRSLLRENSAAGWLMYGIAIVAVLTAILVRRSVGKSPK